MQVIPQTKNVNYFACEMTDVVSIVRTRARHPENFARSRGISEQEAVQTSKYATLDREISRWPGPPSK